MKSTKGRKPPEPKDGSTVERRRRSIAKRGPTRRQPAGASSSVEESDTARRATRKGTPRVGRPVTFVDGFPCHALSAVRTAYLRKVEELAASMRVEARDVRRLERCSSLERVTVGELRRHVESLGLRLELVATSPTGVRIALGGSHTRSQAPVPVDALTFATASLGHNLRAARTHARLSQGALAKRLGVAVGDVAAIEAGRRRPSEAYVRRLLDACGAPSSLPREPSGIAPGGS